MARLLALLLTALVTTAWAASDAAPGTPWLEWGDDGEPRVQLYFFWTRTCPHCRRAKPFVRRLAADHDWLEVHSLELSRGSPNLERYAALAASLGREATSVPAFLFCGQMITGFDGDDALGAWLRQALERCHAEARADGDAANAGAARAPPLTVPLLGEVAVEDLSLPVLTVVLAGLDSFNPCAFFVLFFLLSLLIHARSRLRMLAIGGTFVVFSGLVYFLFMAAWLNLFLVVGHLPAVTLGAGLVALVFGAINTKDYFLFRRGMSLTIPDAAKPRLFQRMRGLLNADSPVAMLTGAAVLALAANSYELLCTAGFPMVFTRVLTLREAGAAEYYGYLVLYNVVYVIPLAVIVALFALTLGSRRLTEREGRILKLLSGLMMLGLGLLLVAAPGMLDNLTTAVALLVGAVGLTWLTVRLAPPAD